MHLQMDSITYQLQLKRAASFNRYLRGTWVNAIPQVALSMSLDGPDRAKKLGLDGWPS